MCGRYTLIADLDELARRFEFDGGRQLSLKPAYNIAPAQQVISVREDGDGRQAAFMRWYLIPSWAKDLSIGARMINARADTVAEKPAFRRRRCLVLTDGFYEWQRAPGSSAKRPMRVVPRTEGPFAFAVLWETWKHPDGQVIASCAIITTEANRLLTPIRHRMLSYRQERSKPSGWTHTPTPWKPTKFPPWSTQRATTRRRSWNESTDGREARLRSLYGPGQQRQPA